MNFIRVFLAALLTFYTPIALAQTSGGITKSGTINPNDIAIFKNSAQIMALPGTPIANQCIIYTGTYPSGSWGPGSCASGGAGTVTSVTAAMGNGMALTGTCSTVSVFSCTFSLANMAALSLKGNATNATAPASDIAAVAASDCVFRESGSAVACGQVATAGIANAAVTLSKLLPTVFQCSSAAALGFNGNGVASNDTAFNTWYSSLSSAGGCLQFGVGKFLFSAAVNKTMAAARQSITIAGLGSDLTQLYWPAGGGMKFTQGSSLNSMHFRDLTFVTGAANTGTGLWLNSTQTVGSAVQSDISNVQIRGDDFDDIATNTMYWAIGFNDLGWSNVLVQNTNSYGLLGAPLTAGGGIGAQVGGSGPTNITILVTFLNSLFLFHAVGVQVNSYWEGVTLDNVNINGQTGTVGLYNPSAQTHSGPYLLVRGSQFDSGGIQINLLSDVKQFQMYNGSITLTGNSNYGALVAGASQDLKIEGVNFNVSAAYTGLTGIFYTGTRGNIVGNTFVGVAGATACSGSPCTLTAVDLSGGASAVTVGPNTYQSITTRVAVPGSSTNTIIDFSVGVFASAICNAGLKGTMYTVTDSTVNTWGTNIIGGGAITVLGYCNGTALTVVGK